MEKLLKDLRTAAQSAEAQAAKSKGTQRLRLKSLAGTLVATANSLKAENNDVAQPSLASLRQVEVTVG